MERVQGLGGALGDFRISGFPAELYILIAEELGRHIRQQPAILQDTDGVLPDDQVEAGVVEVTDYMVQNFPTMHMLTAGMVNKYFYGTIRDIALRWDALSETPKAVHFATVRGNVGLLEQALRHPNSNPNYVPGYNFTPLLTAIMNGNLQALNLLLAHGAYTGVDERWPVALGSSFVNSPTTLLNDDFQTEGRRATPLHCCLALPRKQSDIALAILAHLPPEFNDIIADPAEKLLGLAVARDYVELIGPLMERGATLDQGGTTVHGRQTPLTHHAISRTMLLRLIQAGVNVHTPVEVGLNALHAVCLRRIDCRDVVSELARRIDVNEPTAGGWQRASLIQQPDTRALISVPPQTALNLACRQLNYLHVQTLLTCGANPLGTDHALGELDTPYTGNYYQTSPLHDLFLPEYLTRHPMARKGPVISGAILKSMDALFQHGGKAALQRRHNVTMGNPLRQCAAKIDATYWSHERIARDGRTRGLAAAVSAYTPFEVFFLQPLVDDERIPQAMWDACGEVAEQINNRMTPYGITPLIALLSHRFQHASGEANFYRPRLVEWLLNHGADPNMADGEGFAPLHYAAFWLDTTAIRLLIQYGAVNPPPEADSIMTPLEVALGALYTNKQLTDMLLRNPGVGSWQSMVELIDRHRRREIFGLADCVEYWTPEYEFPACAFPMMQERCEIQDHSRIHADLHTEDVSLATKIGQTDMIRRGIEAKRCEIVKILLKQPGQLRMPTRLSASQMRPSSLSTNFGNVVPPTALDWAVMISTQSSHSVVDDVMEAGGKFSAHPPSFGSRTIDQRPYQMAWLWRKRYCAEWEPHTVVM